VETKVQILSALLTYPLLNRVQVSLMRTRAAGSACLPIYAFPLAIQASVLFIQVDANGIPPCLQPVLAGKCKSTIGQLIQCVVFQQGAVARFKAAAD
jgi:hypothetical protein